MASDVKWIKITTDIFDDEKILLIESLPDPYAIITCWFKLLCLAGKQNNSGVFMMGRIAYTDKMLATIFRMNEATVKMALNTFEQFGMVEVIDGVITIPNWGKHQNLEQLEERRRYQREYQKEYRKKQKLLASNEEESKCLREPLREPSHQPNVNTPEEDKEKEIEKEIDKKNSAVQPSKADVDAFFESIWELYPVKKGKGQVSDTKRKVLFNIGYERLEQAINRYLKELKKDASWRKPQNGSTFFNSGYVDYLDENYVPDQTVGGRTEKLPDWFGKRQLDDDEKHAIQRMLSEPKELGMAEHLAIQQIMSEEDQAEAEQLRRELQASFGGRR